MDSTSIHSRGLPSIWDFLSRGEERQGIANILGEFQDPDPEHPVDASEFLAGLDTRDLVARVWKRYSKPQQVRWNPEGMLRVVLFFGIKGYQHLTQAWRDLHHRPELAWSFGLDDVPPYKTLWHFVHKRLGFDGVHELFSRLVELVVSEGRARGLPLGEVVSVDSMPIETCIRDTRAQYNPHYEVRGYKAHNVVDTELGVPLDFKLTMLNRNETREIQDALRRAKGRGCPIVDVLADSQYNGCDNFGMVCQELGARFWTRFPKTSAVDAAGEADRLWDRYERCWKDDGYVPGVSFEHRLEYLYRRGGPHRIDVGRYHRNEAFRLLLSDPERYELMYNRRTLLEGNQGYWKQHVGMTKLEGRSMEFIDVRVRVRLMGILAVALTRLQNGICSGLCETVGIQ
jgi:hypothetical protein